MRIANCVGPNMFTHLRARQRVRISVGDADAVDVATIDGRWEAVGSAPRFVGARPDGPHLPRSAAAVLEGWAVVKTVCHVAFDELCVALFVACSCGVPVTTGKENALLSTCSIHCILFLYHWDPLRIWTPHHLVHDLSTLRRKRTLWAVPLHL